MVAKAERTVTCIIIPNDVQEMSAVEAPPRKHGTIHSGVGYAPSPWGNLPEHKYIAPPEPMLSAVKLFSIFAIATLGIAAGVRFLTERNK